MNLRSAWLAAALVAVATGASAQEKVVRSEKGNLRLSTVASGLEAPWGLAFLPDGRMLVTERPGRLRYVTAGGQLSAPITGVPKVFAVGQGGLLDVALDPAFPDNRTIYLSFSEPVDGKARTAVARARLGADRLEDVQVIFRQQPAVDARHHFGSRLVFDREGRLYVTMGDRGSQRDSAQDLGTHIGKVARINPDGSVPADNPFVAREGAKPEIWSYGHRNIQGAALHPATGELWTHEHGPRGGDEINIARAGLNYGWPVITYGREYHGPKIGEGTAKAGMEQPLHYWVPSIGPSGMAFYTADAIPGWKGNLLVGALASMQVARLEIGPDNKVRHEERIAIAERVRDVRQGPDGAVYLLTDMGPGSRILRLSSAR
ncbi:MAG: PQQ-dependent sugar dehydrogenase [Steroidobacteraceae bacterium]|jgi:glucose/arabinose dehydrogenase|nr:PQQ-dependent sugar dehydrogenase [Steroidobacteraceae bacterium]